MPVVPAGQILAELPFAGICTAGGTGSRPVVPVGLFLASSSAFSCLDLRTPVVPVVAPVVPTGVLYSSINSSLLFSKSWLAHSSYSTSEKTVSKFCLTHSLSLLLLDFISWEIRAREVRLESWELWSVTWALRSSCCRFGLYLLILGSWNPSRLDVLRGCPCWFICEGTPKCLYYPLILSGNIKLTFLVAWGGDLSGQTFVVTSTTGT